MYLLYVFIAVYCFGFGIYYLFFAPEPSLAVHYLLLSLFGYIIVFELLRKPFQRRIYVLATVLLIIEGVYQLFFLQNILSGIVSIFFGFSLWQSRTRLKR